MRAFADHSVEVAAQVLGPIIVEAASYLDFENIPGLLCDDFRGGPLGN